MDDMNLKGSVEQMVREHADLKTALGELRGFLDGPRPDLGAEGSHRWAAALSGRLVTLHDQLFRHFRHEERAGLLEELGRRKPGAFRQIEALLHDHGGILSGIRELMAATLTFSEGKTPEDPRLRRRVLTLLDRLERHEHEETELVQGIEYLDVGAGD